MRKDGNNENSLKNTKKVECHQPVELRSGCETGGRRLEVERRRTFLPRGSNPPLEINSQS